MRIPVAQLTLVLPAASALPGAGIQSADPDPLDTERFASESDYSKGDNFTPAKAQLQTIIGRERQRVSLGVLHTVLLCGC